MKEDRQHNSSFGIGDLNRDGKTDAQDYFLWEELNKGNKESVKGGTKRANTPDTASGCLTPIVIFLLILQALKWIAELLL